MAKKKRKTGAIIAWVLGIAAVVAAVIVAILVRLKAAADQPAGAAAEPATGQFTTDAGPAIRSEAADDDDDVALTVKAGTSFGDFL